MNDSRLKPWLLHSIMATHLPDDKQPTRAPIQLSMAVASIRRHHLLSETSPVLGTMLIQQGGKAMDGRKGAVEAWIDRLMSLLASSVVGFWFRDCPFCLLRSSVSNSAGRAPFRLKCQVIVLWVHLVSQGKHPACQRVFFSGFSLATLINAQSHNCFRLRTAGLGFASWE